MDILKMSKFFNVRSFFLIQFPQYHLYFEHEEVFFNVRSFFFIQLALYHLFWRQLSSFTATVALVHRREMVNVTAYGLF